VAHEFHTLLKTALHAFQDDGSPVPLDQRGIGSVLDIAVRMTGDLIEQCATLEKG
jgi:hypothetical protein